MSRVPLLWMAAAVSVALTGCSNTPLPNALGLPGAATPARVTDVVERGDYLDASIEGTGSDHAGGRVSRRGLALRFFFPRESTCQGVLVPETDVEYVQGGRLGRVRSANGTCDPVGVASLRAWRDRRPRSRRDRLGVPRAQAVFTPIFRDEQLVLVRGRFPLANRLGWIGGEDVIAAIPRRPECENVLERGVGSLEFRVVGEDPLRLIQGTGFCPVIGLIHPPANR
jgi:hypothetical protein